MITQEDVTRQIVITAEGRDAAISIERTMREFGHLEPRSIGEWDFALPADEHGQSPRDFAFRTVQLNASPPDEIIERVNRQKGIRVEPNTILSAAARPVDPLYDEQWALPRMAAEPAWDCVAATEPRHPVLVAIVDSGISAVPPHPDLPAVDERSRRFIDPAPDTFIEDEDGHGTFLAGTIAAVSSNAQGIASITWRIRVNLLVLKFYDPWSVMTGANAARAIAYAAAQHAQVINVSWHIGMDSLFLRLAVLFATARDAVFVAAAGNEGTDNDVLPIWPASYVAPNIVSVMATTRISTRPIDLLDDKPGFSNYGAATVHLAAPGVGILSTHYFLQTPKYRRYTGTSASAAHVSAAAAVIRGLRPAWTAEQVRRRLMATVDPSRHLRCIAGGRLNLRNAVCGLPVSG